MRVIHISYRGTDISDHVVYGDCDYRLSDGEKFTPATLHKVRNCVKDMEQFKSIVIFAFSEYDEEEES